jgi:hypothetical protein
VDSRGVRRLRELARSLGAGPSDEAAGPAGRNDEHPDGCGRLSCDLVGGPLDGSVAAVSCQDGLPSRLLRVPIPAEPGELFEQALADRWAGSYPTVLLVSYERDRLRPDTARWAYRFVA